jgi:hypothetical protein
LGLGLVCNWLINLLLLRLNRHWLIHGLRLLLLIDLLDRLLLLIDWLNYLDLLNRDCLLHRSWCYRCFRIRWHAVTPSLTMAMEIDACENEGLDE